MNKNMLLIVGIIGIGVFVLPSTLSLFAGQHSWYDPASATGIPCEKCHFLEEEELLSAVGPHNPNYVSIINTSANYNGTAGEPGGSDFWGGDTVTDRCYGCHQATGSANSSHALYDTWDNQRNYTHAAVAVWCLDCHPWVESELKNTSAAHKPFYEDLKNESEIGILRSKNMACIGCHTHVGVNISWTRNEYVSYNITGNKTGYVVEWNNTDDLGTNDSRFQSMPGY